MKTIYVGVLIALIFSFLTISLCDTATTLLWNIILLSLLPTIGRFIYNKENITPYVVAYNVLIWIVFLAERLMYSSFFNTETKGVWLLAFWITIVFVSFIQTCCSWIILIIRRKLPLNYFIHELKYIIIIGGISFFLTLILALI